MGEVITVNRADLYWAIDSTLPHVKHTLCFTLSPTGVGVSATDGHTMASAIALITAETGAWGDLSVHLPKAEAEVLMRAVRPTLVAHRAENVNLLVDGVDLHVQMEGEDGEVYEGSPEQPTWTILTLKDHAAWLTTRPRPAGSEMVFDPDLLARFKKVKREPGDRLFVFPVQLAHGTGAVITVGSNFLGAIAGMEFPADSQLEKWIAA